jgi:hypothetical protein
MERLGQLRFRTMGHVISHLIYWEGSIFVLPDLTRVDRTQRRQVPVLVKAEVRGAPENDLRAPAVAVSHQAAEVGHCAGGEEKAGRLAKHFG